MHLKILVINTKEESKFKGCEFMLIKKIFKNKKDNQHEKNNQTKKAIVNEYSKNEKLCMCSGYYPFLEKKYKK